MYYVGIDMHKNYFNTAVMDRRGKILEEKKYPHDSSGMKRFLKRTKSRGKSRVVIESSANLWIPIYNLLEEEEVEVILAHPMKVKAIASAKIKTDKMDARILAHLLRSDLVPKAYVPDKETRDKRELVRYRIFLVKMQTEIKNKIHSILMKNNVRLQNPFSNEGIQALKNLKLNEVDRLIIDTNLAILGQLGKQIGQITKNIAKKAINQEDVKLLMSIPGIDFYSAMLILSEIGDVKRFPSKKHIVSWAGLAPSMHQSGQTMYRGRITKQGSKWLRWILIQCAHVARRYDSRLGEFYDRIVVRAGKKKAIVATARKLLVSIYYMLSNKVNYFDREVDRIKINRLNRIVKK